MSNPANSLAERYPTALVTGAASGVGKAIAEAFLVEGLTVYGTSRRPDASGLNPAIRWIRFEGAHSTAVKTFLEAESDLLGKIDILVNNAGSAVFGEAFEQSDDELQEQITLLLESPARLCRAVIPAMQQRGRGAIVNVSSMASTFPLPYLAAYSAGKAGLSQFTQSLISTGQRTGLQIIDFQLGDYRTAFNQAMARKPELSHSEQRVWDQLEANLQAAPAPGKAARDLIKILGRGRSGIIRSGGFFQARLAPLGARLIPRALLLKAIRWYYRLPVS